MVCEHICFDKAAAEKKGKRAQKIDIERFIGEKKNFSVFRPHKHFFLLLLCVLSIGEAFKLLLHRISINVLSYPQIRLLQSHVSFLLREGEENWGEMGIINDDVSNVEREEEESFFVVGWNWMGWAGDENRCCRRHPLQKNFQFDLHFAYLRLSASSCVCRMIILFISMEKFFNEAGWKYLQKFTFIIR
jgi:hypothetical protein